MRVLSFRRTFRRLFSFASMGISRAAGRGIRRRNRAFKQRRDSFNCWRLDSEQLEPKKVFAVDLSGLTPDLVGGSDTGPDATDDYTADTTPTFSINPAGLGAGASNFSAGDELRLFSGTTRVGSHTIVDANIDTDGIWDGGPVQITSSQVLGGDPNTLAFKISHFDGGLGTATNTLSVDIDNQAPATPTTNNNTIADGDPNPGSISGTADLAGALGTQEKLEVTLNGVTYDTDTDGVAFTFGPGTTWVLDLTAVGTIPNDFVDGTYPVSVTHTDRAGNSITGTNANGLLVDTVIPTMTAITGPGTAATFIDGSTIPIQVTFSEPIDRATFGGGNTLTFTLNGGARTVSGPTLTGVDTTANTATGFRFDYTVNEAYGGAATGNTTAGSSTLTDIDSTGITLGMLVRGTGIPDGTTVLGITELGVGSFDQITLSNDATQTTTGATFTFGDSTADFITVIGITGGTITDDAGNPLQNYTDLNRQGDTTAGSDIVTNINANGIAAGMAVTGAGIPAGTRVGAVNELGPGSVDQLTLVDALGDSVLATATNTTTLNFTGTQLDLRIRAGVPTGQVIGAFDAVATGPIAVPLQTAFIRFNAGVNVGTGVGLIQLDDFQLTHNGEPVNLSVVPEGGFTQALLSFDSTVTAPDVFAIQHLDQYTDEPGQYILAFADAGVSEEVAQISWVKSVATVEEVEVLITPRLANTDPALDTLGNTDQPLLPVEFVDIQFYSDSTDNTGAAIRIDTPMENVDTTVSGAAISQFELYRDGVQVSFPTTATITAIDQSTYRISGLSSLTATAGSYSIRVPKSSGFRSVDSPTVPIFTPGVEMIKDYGEAWRKVEETTATVTYPTGGATAYGPGEELVFVADFTSVVNVGTDSNAPRIEFAVNGAPQSASYVSGSGSNQLIFKYTVTTNDFDGIGVVVAENFSGSIVDANGEDVNSTFTPNAAGKILVDGDPPDVVTVTGPSAGLYFSGQTLVLTVQFDQDVVVSNGTGGNLAIPITIGTSSVNANYTSGSGSSVLRFETAALTSAEATQEGIQIGQLSVNSNVSIQDLNGTTGSLSYTPPSGAGVLVNRFGPTLEVPADGVYALNDNLTLSLNYSATSQNLVVTGNPELQLQLDSGNVTVSYSGNASLAQNGVLQFTYQVGEDEVDADGITIATNALSLNGGAIIDQEGNAVITSFQNVDTTGIEVDGDVPDITAVNGPAVGVYIQGQTLQVTVAFDQDVFVANGTSGNLSIPLTIGSDTVNANYTSGSGTNTLTFATDNLNSTVFTSTGISIGQLSLATNTTITDESGNNNGSLAFAMPSGAGVVVNQFGPDITLPADKTYTLGDDINITANYTGQVTVVGTPSINIQLDSGSVTAAYNKAASDATNGSLVFSYQVAEDDLDANGIAIPAAGISLNGGAIIDQEGNAVITSFQNVDTTGIEVDGDVPDITAVNGPAVGVYIQGQTLQVTVAFDQDVFVANGTSGNLSIPLTIGSDTVNANYTSGSGTNTLTFATDNLNSTVFTSTGISIGQLSLATNTTITDESGNNNGSLAFAMPSGAGVVVNQFGPDITLPADKTYTLGDDINITANYTGQVTVVGTPSINIQLDSGSVTAAYNKAASDATNGSLVFSYQVAEDDLDANGIAIPAAGISLNGGAIIDQEGNAVITSFQNVDTTGIEVDGDVPDITAVNGPAVGVYIQGQTLQVTVAFDQDVFVANGTSGNLSIPLTIGSDTVNANYTSGSGTNTLTFATDNLNSTVFTSTGISIGQLSLATNTTITDESGNNNGSLAFAMPSGAGVVVNQFGPDITLPADKTYTLGDDINITTNYTGQVTVVGTPSINIQLDSGSVTAAYNKAASDATNGSLVFSYQVAEDDLDANGIAIPAAGISLNGGAIIDQEGNAVITSFQNVDTTGIEVDGDVPDITAVNGPAVGVYIQGQTLQVTVAFDQDVFVANGTSGNLSIPLTIGSDTVNANYTSGSGTNTLTFATDNLNSTVFTSTGISIGQLSLATNTTITDESGNNNGSLAFAMPSGAGVVVNQFGPDITLPADKTYTLGDDINITANYTGQVTVVGTPSINIQLDSGSVTAAYNKAASDATNGSLVFSYQVAEDDLDANGIAIPAAGISLNGGAIIDQEGNAVITSFQNVDTTGIEVDGDVPDITAVNGPAVGVYIQGQTLQVTVAFDQDVFVANGTSGNLSIPLTIGSDTVNANYTSGSGTNTLTFATDNLNSTVFTSTGISIGQLSLATNTTITDESGNNNGSLAFAMPSGAGVFVNALSPTVTVTGTGNGTYGIGDVVELSANFAVPVAVTGTPSIGLLVGATPVQATYTSGSGTTTLKFRYEIAPGDLDDQGGIEIPSSFITLGANTSIAGVDSGADVALAFTAPDTSNIAVDGVAPTVSAVVGPDAGTYGTTENLSVEVKFDENVTVTGAPTIPLSINGQTVLATYASTNNDTITFTTADLTSDLSSTGTPGEVTIGQINLNGGSIADANDNDATLTLVAPTVEGVVINEIGVNSLTASSNGTYAVGDTVELSATFSTAVAVTGTPSIGLLVGATPVQATYTSGSGTTTLKFRYEIAPGDLDDQGGIEIPSSFITLGANTSIAGVDSGADVALAFTAPDTSNIAVDGVAPTVSAVVGPDAGTYGTTENLSVEVKFDENVTVTGAPTIPLSINGQTVLATYASTNNDTITFTTADLTSDLSSTGTPGEVTIGQINLNGGSIADANDNDATLTLVAPTVEGVVINEIGVNSLTASSNGTYAVGDTVELSATFSTAVAVTGTPSIGLLVGATPVQATYTSGSGTTTLKFRYEIAPGDLDDQGGIEIPSSFITLGANTSIAGVDSGADVALAFTAPDTSNIAVDGVAPTVSAVVGPDAGTYGTTENLSVEVKFDENVTVTGAPTIPLSINGQTVLATYASTNNDTITFTTADLTSDLSSTGTPGEVTIGQINLNGGSIADANDNDATLTLVAPTVEGVVINEIGVNSLTASSNGTYAVGDTVELSATFSTAVAVTGTPSIGLLVGATPVQATYTSGSGTTTLKFRYEIAPGDLDDQGGIEIPSSFITLGANTSIAGVDSGADVALAFTAPDTSNIAVDGVAPTVSAVVGPDAGTYGTTENLSVEVKFDENVTVTGAPTIPLSINGQTVLATYASTNNDTITFTTADLTSDLSSTGTPGEVTIGQINLNGGSIADANDNDATLTLVAPTVEGVVINEIGVNSLTASSNGTYAVGDTVELSATFSTAVAVTGTPSIGLLVGATPVQATYTSGSGTTTLKFRYEIAPGDLDDQGGIEIPSSFITLGANTSIAGVDSGADVALAFTAPDTSNIAVDGVAPTVSAVVGPDAGTYGTTENLSVEVKFDENVTVTGAPTIPLSINGQTVLATYASTNNDTITFTTADLTSDLSSTGTPGEVTIGQINLNGGSIADANDNDATLTLVAPTVEGVVINEIGVNSLTASSNGTYAVGDTVELSATFSTAVAVTGTPSIGLLVGATPVQATYTSGSGTTTLKFRYEIAPGDLDDQGGIEIPSSFITLGANTSIAGVDSGADVALAFTAPDTSNIAVDGVAPTIADVLVPAAGSYDTTTSLTFTVLYDEAVVLTKGSFNATLPVTIGGALIQAEYTGNYGVGNETASLAFSTGNLPLAASSSGLTGEITLGQINLYGGSLDDEAGNEGGVALPATPISGVIVNQLAPTVTVTGLGNIIYDIDQVIEFTADFGEAVDVTGVPTIGLLIGSNTVDAEYVTGSGTSAIKFRYIVQEGDLDEDGIEIPTAAITIPAGAAIAGAESGGPVGLTFTPPDTSEVKVNALPRVTKVDTAKADGTYDTGEVIDIIVTTSRPVRVEDAANTKLFLNTNENATDYAVFLGDSSVFSNSLLFRYTVQDGDDSADLDYLNTTALSFTEGKIQTLAGTNLSATLQVPGTVNSIAFSHDIEINTRPPQIEGFSTINPDGAYGTGQTVGIRATLSERIPAGQQFSVMLDTGAVVTLTVDSLSQGGSNRASGIYVIQAGDTSDSLRVLDIIPGSLTDASGNALLTALPLSITIGNITIDTAPPKISHFNVTEIDSTPIAAVGETGIYGIGTEFLIVATASETIRAGSTVDATLSNGVLVRLTALAAGTTLSGTYTVAGDDPSTDDLTIDSFSPIVMRDLAGNQLASTALPGYPRNIGDLHDLNVDTLPPNVTGFTAADGFYKAGDNVTITATLSEAIQGNHSLNILLTGSRAATLSIVDGEDIAVGNYTVQPGDTVADLTVTKIYAGTVEDYANNPLFTLLPAGTNLGDNANIVLDTTAPTVASLTADANSLNAAQTTTLSISLSENSTTFEITDLDANNGTFSNFNGSGTAYTVDFTPEADFEGNVTVSVLNASFTDLAGNNFTAASPNVTLEVDTLAPTLSITADDTSLSIGEIATLTFTLSEASDDFTANDVTVANGNLSSFSGSGALYTATFTPDADFEGNVTVSVGDSQFTDAFANPSEAGNLTIAVDTKAPTATLSSSIDPVNASQTATINITLSEPSADFDFADLTVENGTLNASTFSGSGTNYSVVFEPNASTEGPGSVGILTGSFSDSFGNNQSADSTNATFSVDTIAPTVSNVSADVATLNGTQSATISFTLSEASDNFDANDVVVANGTLTNFSGAGTNYTATFTPETGFEGNIAISIANGSFSDLPGNDFANGSPNVTLQVDTLAPTVNGLTPDDANLSIGENATLTITLSEASADFAADDISVSSGNITSISGNGTNYTAVFTPNIDFEGDVTISVDGGTFTDSFANPNDASGNLTIAVDTKAPTATLSTNTDPVNASQTATISITLSEDSTDFEFADLTAENGSLNASTFAGSGSNYTVVFTPTPGTEGTGSVGVITGSFSDLAGNNQAVDSTNATFLVDTIAPTVTGLTSDVATLNGTQTATLTITLSEPSNDFTADDLSVTNGNISITGSGTNYTAVFTPDADFEGNISISVANGSFTDVPGNAYASASPTANLAIDTLAPAAPALALEGFLPVTDPVSLGEATQVAGLITVQGESGAAIAVEFTGTAGSVQKTVASNGSLQGVNLTVSEANSLGQGPVSVTAFQTDAFGNPQTDPANSTSFELDTIAPEAATIGLADGVTDAVSSTESLAPIKVAGEVDAALTVTFTGDSGTIVQDLTGTGLDQTVNLNAAQLATLDTDGVGTINVSVVQSDLAGNPQSDPAETASFMLDRVAPATPSLTLVGTDPISLAEAAAPVAVAGEADATITVLFQGQNGTVTRTLTGTGSTQNVSLNAAQITSLGDGLVLVTASQVDQAGNPQSTAANISSFTLDTVAPVAPVVALGNGVTDAASRNEATRLAGVITVQGELASNITINLLGTSGQTVTKTVTGDGTAQGVVLDSNDLGTLGDGLVLVSATQADEAGNPQSLPAATMSFNLDATAPTPAGLLLNVPAEDLPVGLDEVTQVGGIVTVSGENNANLTVTFDGPTNDITKSLVGTGSPQIVTLTESEATFLGQGNVTVSVSQTDAAGNAQNGTPASATFGLDTVAPVAPVVALEGSVIRPVSKAEATQDPAGVVTIASEASATVAVTFTGTAGLIVKSYTSTGTDGVVLTNDDLLALGEGNVNVSAIATDPAGNVGPTGTASFLLDSIAPVTPVIALTAGADDPVSKSEALSASGIVTITGEVGASVVVTLTGTSDTVTRSFTGTGLAQAVVLSGPDLTTLGEGSVVVTAVVTDEAGNESSVGRLPSFTLDTAAPSAPVLALHASVTDPITAAEATQASGIATITGELGAEVTVTFLGENGLPVVKSVIANGPGSLIPVTLTSGDLAALGDGLVNVSARQTDEAGNPQAASSATLAFTLDTSAPAVTGLSTTTAAGNYKAGETIALVATLSEPTTTGSSFTAVLNTGATVTFVAPAGGTVLNASYTIGGSHNANPLAVVSLLSGDVTDAAGNALATTVPASNSFAGIAVDTTAPQPASLVLIADDVVSADEATAAGGIATVTGEAGAAIVVTITGTGGAVTRNLLGTGSPQAIGLTPSNLPTLGDGLVTITAVQTDPAGNRQILPDQSIDFTLDTVVPGTPTLDYGTDVDDGATAAEATQASGVVRVTGEAAATISIILYGESGTVSKSVIGNGVAQAVRLTSGELSTLGEGLVVISATQTDEAGNEQPIPVELTFNLDTVAPAAPTVGLAGTITSPLSYEEVTRSGGVVTVRGEAGASIAITFDGVLDGFVKTLTGTGFNQQIVLSPAEVAQLGDGAVNITAIQTDEAGNTGVSSAPLNVAIDTVDPTIVSRVLDQPAGFYNEGDQIPVIITLSEPAIPGQQLTVVLNVLDGSGAKVRVTATVGSGSDANKALSTYTVVAGHNTDDLTIDSVLNDAPTNFVTDVAGNRLVDDSLASGMPAYGGTPATGIVVDTIAPTLAGASSPSPKETYNEGDVVTIVVSLSEVVQAGSYLEVRVNSQSDADPALRLEATHDGNTLIGYYTVGLAEMADELSVTSVQADIRDLAGNQLVHGNGNALVSALLTGIVIDGSITLSEPPTYGPVPENGYQSVVIDLGTEVTGVSLDAFTLTYNGRTISLRDASVTGDGANYVLRLPDRVAKLEGGFTITIWSTDIRSLTDPDVGMDKPIIFEMPDAGMNTDLENGRTTG